MDTDEEFSLHMLDLGLIGRTREYYAPKIRGMRMLGISWEGIEARLKAEGIGRAAEAEIAARSVTL
jgi:hypothetical protein